MRHRRGGSDRSSWGLSNPGFAALVVGLVALGAVGSAGQAAVSPRASAAAVSTTWAQLKSDCTKPPPGPSGNWISEGNGCWDQASAYGSWMVSDGHASVTQPSFSVNMSWSMPGQIAGSGGKGSISVMTTGGVAQRICVLQAYTSFTIAGGGDSCAQTSASMSSASASPNLLPNDAADGTIGYVWVSLGDGGNLYYTYRASNPQPPPTVETVPTPSAFDQTVTAPEPPPGGAALITSPALAMFGAVQAPVSVDVKGLSVRDQVIAAARHDCYVQAVRAIRGAIASKLIGKWKSDLTNYRETLESFVLSSLASCLAFVDAYEQVLKAPAADVARASCAETPVRLAITGSGRKARLKSFHLGDTHQPLKVSCVRTAGGIRITLSTRSKHAPLSSAVGSRLRLALYRSTKDPSGGQLSVTFHHG